MTRPDHALSLEWTWAWPTDWSAAYAVHALSLAPLLVAFVVAAIVDWRSRKIPNWLTFMLLGGGVLRSFASWASGVDFTPVDAMLGVGFGFAIGLPLFVLGARGAGDAKLYIAAGAWLGWQGLAALAVLEAVVGCVAVLARAAATGKLRELLRNTLTLLTAILHVRRIGTEQAVATGKRYTIYGETPATVGRFTSVARPLPHAVPFLAAAVLALLLGRL